MTATERRRLFEQLQDERLKGLEAWQRLFDGRSASEDAHHPAAGAVHPHSAPVSGQVRQTGATRLEIGSAEGSLATNQSTETNAE